MTIKYTLSNKWLKAAVLGCLWASSEIVLGSFLHNLRIPFAGIFLTGIGIILLISVAQIWKDKGLFWRAGIVCALMKSISPSAIIFGPMIAIFCEALLMEFSVRIFRRNILSFLVAGMLAMSWNLFHVLANYIVIYGFNIIDLYVNLTKFAQKQLNIVNDNYWLPILVLLSLYVFMGLIAAILGIYIGRKAARQPKSISSLSIAQVLEIKSSKKDELFHFSLAWLLLNVLFLTSALALMSFAGWKYWITYGVVILLIWTLQYKKSLKPLAKPKFWIFFMLITLASGYLLFALNHTEGGALKGLLIGLEMNFRAAVTIVGFSTIGTELRNPRIRNMFTNTRLKQVPLALEVAFDALPLVLANLPRLQDTFLHPVKIFHELVSQADFWLKKVEMKMYNRENIIIIKGVEKEGKSSFVKQIVDNLKHSNIKAGGIISPAVFENNIHVGYDLIDVATEKRTQLSRTEGESDRPKVGNYFFFTGGIDFGEKALDFDNINNADIVVVDEIGPWELKNQGWAESINQLIKSFEKPMIWVVRESIVEKVIENWSLKNPEVFDIKDKCIDAVCACALALIKK